MERSKFFDFLAGEFTFSETRGVLKHKFSLGIGKNLKFSFVFSSVAFIKFRLSKIIRFRQ